MSGARQVQQHIENGFDLIKAQQESAAEAHKDADDEAIGLYCRIKYYAEQNAEIGAIATKFGSHEFLQVGLILDDIGEARKIGKQTATVTFFNAQWDKNTSMPIANFLRLAFGFKVITEDKAFIIDFKRHSDPQVLIFERKKASKKQMSAFYESRKDMKARRIELAGNACRQFGCNDFFWMAEAINSCGRALKRNDAHAVVHQNSVHCGVDDLEDAEDKDFSKFKYNLLSDFMVTSFGYKLEVIGKSTAIYYRRMPKW